MKEHFQILQLATNNKLPDPIDDNSEYSMDIVAELIDEGYLKAIDVGACGYVGYASPKITLQGREYLTKLSLGYKGESQMPSNGVRVFISHSSEDVNFVTELVELLRASLNLGAEEIRCTSVDGYGLPAGAVTSDQLRDEVYSTDEFIGVISNESIKSLFVVFELGARWGANRHLIPLLTPGTDTSILSAPLSGMNALSSTNHAQLHQLVEDLGKNLSIPPQPTASYSRHIDAILALPVSTQSELTEVGRDTWGPDNYELVQADGGAMVYRSIESPEHYICPNCFPNEIKILQDRGVVSGNFDCTGCQSTFLVKRRRA